MNSLQNLYTARSERVNGRTKGHRSLTRVVFFKSLSAYILTTLTATSCPRYSRFHTSPNPPLYNATPSGLSSKCICNDLGSRPWPVHALYSDFRHLFRTRDARSGLSDAFHMSRAGLMDTFPGRERSRTSSAASIKIWASAPRRCPTISVALLLQQIVSTSATR